MNLLELWSQVGMLLWLVRAGGAKPIQPMNIKNPLPSWSWKRTLDAHPKEDVTKIDKSSMEAMVHSPAIPVDVKATEKIFSFHDDKEVLRALKLAGVSLMHKAITLGMVGAAWLLFIRSIGDIVKSVSSSLKYSTSEDFSNNNSISESLKSFLKPNIELTGEELSLLSQYQLPSDILDSLEQLGGLQPIKQVLLNQYFVLKNDSDTIDNSNNQKSAATHLHASRHSALLYGPPGCGKTSLVRSFCRHIQSPLLEVTPSMVQHRFFGESTKTLKAIFTLAKKMKHCVIFIDELDALFTSRHTFEASHDRSIKTEFMQSWDNLLREYAHYPNIFIFGATNRPQDIDPAILRRFEQSFHIGLPSRADRMLIWQQLFEKIPFGAKNVDLARCVLLTEGFSASDIQGLCRNLVSHMISTKKATITTEDVAYVAKSFSPTSWAASKYGHMNDNGYSRNDAGVFPASHSEENDMNDNYNEFHSESNFFYTDNLFDSEQLNPAFFPDNNKATTNNNLQMERTMNSRLDVKNDTTVEKGKQPIVDSPPSLFDQENNHSDSDQTGH